MRAHSKTKLTQLPDGRGRVYISQDWGQGAMPHFIRPHSKLSGESQKEMEPNPCADTPFEWESSDSMLEVLRSQISSLHFRTFRIPFLPANDVFRGMGIVCPLKGPLDHSFPWKQLISSSVIFVLSDELFLGGSKSSFHRMIEKSNMMSSSPLEQMTTIGALFAPHLYLCGFYYLQSQ